MKRIPLTQGLFAMVDDSMFDYLSQWKWYAHRSGNTIYALRNHIKDGKRRVISMHRIILGLTETGVFCDHRDLDGLNNQTENLRICDKAKNSCNRGVQKNSSSGVKGVVWVEKRKKWCAFIKVNGKSRNFGGFEELKDAAMAYNEAAKQLFGEFAWINKM